MAITERIIEIRERGGGLEVRSELEWRQEIAYLLGEHLSLEVLQR